MHAFARCLLAPLLVAGGLYFPGLCAAQDTPFTFTPVDLKLLEEADLIDTKLEKDGLVYSDRGLTQYLTTVGMAVVGDQPAALVRHPISACHDHDLSRETWKRCRAASGHREGQCRP